MLHCSPVPVRLEGISMIASDCIPHGLCRCGKMGVVMTTCSNTIMGISIIMEIMLLIGPT